VRLDHLLSKESTLPHSGEGIPKLKCVLVGLACLSSRWRFLSLSSACNREPFRPLFRSEGALDLRPRLWRGRSCAPGRLLPVRWPFENYIASTSIFVLPSYKEPTVDALASTTDEGRVWLRKATVSCLKALRTVDVRMGKPGTLAGVTPV
jgi:hypothetical protein